MYPFELLALLALGGLLVGVAWIRELSDTIERADDEHWRFRRMSDLEHRRRRLRRAHILIRVELAIAVAAPLVAAFLYVAAPGFTGGTREPWLIERLLPWAAVAGVIVGLAWMIRLARPEPEGGERTWRFHDL